MAINSERFTTHPLSRRDVSSGFELRDLWHVVPAWRDIPCGYDVIVQVRDDVLSSHLGAHWIAGSGRRSGTYSVDYRPELLDQVTRESIEHSTPIGDRIPVLIAGSGIYYHDIVFTPRRVHFSLVRPRVSLRGGTSGHADVRWGLEISIEFSETDDSLRFRQEQDDRIAGRAGGTAAALEPVVREVSYASNRLQTTASLQLRSVPARYHLWAALVFGGARFELGTPEALAAAYFDTLVAWLSSQLAPEVIVTPRVVLPGYHAGREVSVDLGSMHADMIVTLGNTPGTHVLHLCARLGEDGGDASLELVRPFVGAGDYAIYQHGSVTLPILRAKWSLLDARERQLLVDTPVPLTREGHPVEGRARLRVTLGELIQAEIASAPDTEDLLQLVVHTELEVLQAWDEHDRALDVGGLGVEPADEDLLAVLFYPFRTRVPGEEVPDASRFADRLLTALLKQMYRPFHAEDRPRLRDIGGYTSEALDAVFIRGHLT